MNELSDKQKLALFILVTRDQQGLTQYALAKKAGCSRGVIAMFETDRSEMSAITYWNILKALGKNYNDLQKFLDG